MRRTQSKIDDDMQYYVLSDPVLRHHREGGMKKVLVANRGEIAVRASRACREIGLPFVVVYTDQDVMSEHVLGADESYCLGSKPKEYLNGDTLLRVCRETGARLSLV